jgi:predicted O-methyltransferase YrrM
MKLDEPILMAEQDGAFNKDTFVQAEFKTLQKKFKLKKCIETGTCYGYTSAFLSTFFKEVKTVEVNEKFLTIAKTNRLDALKNVKCYLGSSADLMEEMLEGCGDDTMIFLDAHWQQHCPLKEEIQSIADTGIQPVIAIHDFVVPNHPELGYDKIGDQPFNFEWLKSDFDAVYGEDNYEYYYNSEATKVKRGVIYITPKR